MESIPTTTKIVKKKKLQLVKILDEPEPIPNPEIIFDTLPVPIKNQVQQEEGEIIPLNLEEPVVVDDTIEPLTQPQPQPQPQPSVQTETENHENQENQEKKSMNKQQRQKNKSFQPINNSVFEKALITRDITINIIYIGKYIKETIETILKDEIEGKCSIEGYIKKNSVSVINYSSGTVKAENITFTIVFTCEVCFPVEGMIINCIAMSEPTKAGIRAQHSTEKPSPFVAFISRDHHYNSVYFNSIKNGDTFKARIIGQTFELNDSNISIIAELVKPARDFTKQPNKPRIEF